MKKIFLIIPLGLSIATMGCSSDTEKIVDKETTIETPTTEQQTENSKKDVKVEKFAELVAEGDGQIIDVRTPEEWEGGTLKGAKKINFYDENFKEQLGKLNKKKPVYVYCKSGGRSGKAAKQMKEMGFTSIYNLVGGITAWKKAGNEIVK